MPNDVGEKMMSELRTRMRRVGTGLFGMGLVFAGFGQSMAQPVQPAVATNDSRQAAALARDGKPRVLLITDIGNEPDDAESFVRFVLYANSFDIEGIIASTSVHQRDKVQPQLLRDRIAAYRTVLPNLRVHAPGYPDADRLEALVQSGCPRYGLACVGKGHDTAASRMIIEAADRADPRPLWVSAWGGVADLAQALWSVRATRTPEQVARFVSRVRVYSISDQDDAGPWARRDFPGLFWIASVHGWNQYGMAAWTGISGDLKSPDKWPAADMVTNQWLEQHVRKGPLGALYPAHQFIMEGDTPAFLGLIPNGLNVPDRPDYGGWGGRYVRSDLSAGHFADTVDTVVADDGKRYSSNQATIFRWRDAFQRDFAARIQWSLTGRYDRANHAPVPVLNGVTGLDPVAVTAIPGDRVILDAKGSTDPDRNTLSYRWRYYAEPAGGFRPLPVTIDDSTAARASFIVPETIGPNPIHIVLEVTDDGVPALTRYRRLVVTAPPGSGQKR